MGSAARNSRRVVCRRGRLIPPKVTSSLVTLVLHLADLPGEVPNSQVKWPTTDVFAPDLTDLTPSVPDVPWT